MASDVTYKFVDEPSFRFVDEPLKIGVEGLPDAVKSVAGDFHPLTQMAVGAKGLWDNAAMKMKQSFGGELNPEEQTSVRANRALWESSNPALAGAAVTGAGLLPLAGPAASFAAARLGSVLPRFLAPAVPAGVIGGIVNAASNPVLPGESTNQNIESGGVGGIIGDTLFRGAGRLAQPIVQSEAVKRLLSKDIVPTPGSAAGGFFRDVEDKLTSVPLVGNLIQNARTRSLEEFNRAALRTGTPAGQNISEIGREGVGQGKTAFDKAYGGIYQGHRIGLDDQLTQGLQAAKANTTIPMSADEALKFDTILKREVLDRLGSGPVPTDEAKLVIEANLGKAVGASQGPLQDALRNARTAFRDAMGRSVGEPGASQLKGVDKAYSAFADLKKASKRADAQGGVFTPNQLQRASKPGLLKSLADDAQDVLPSKVPNSGTTDRALSALLYSGAATGAAAPLIGAPYWAMLGTAPFAYSRMGSKYLLGGYPGQEALRGQLGLLAPYGAATGGLLNQP